MPAQTLLHWGHLTCSTRSTTIFMIYFLTDDFEGAYRFIVTLWVDRYSFSCMGFTVPYFCFGVASLFHCLGNTSTLSHLHIFATASLGINMLTYCALIEAYSEALKNLRDLSTSLRVLGSSTSTSTSTSTSRTTSTSTSTSTTTCTSTSSLTFTSLLPCWQAYLLLS